MFKIISKLPIALGTLAAAADLFAQGNLPPATSAPEKKGNIPGEVVFAGDMTPSFALNLIDPDPKVQGALRESLIRKGLHFLAIVADGHHGSKIYDLLASDSEIIATDTPKGAMNSRFAKKLLEYIKIGTEKGASGEQVIKAGLVFEVLNPLHLQSKELREQAQILQVSLNKLSAADFSSSSARDLEVALNATAVFGGR